MAGGRRRWRRVRRWAVGLSLGVAVAVSACGVVAVLLARATPAWWRGLRADDRAVIALAERVERDATGAFTQIRPHDAASGVEGYRSEPWRVSLDEASISAWLTARLPVWMAESDELPAWPAEFSELQVRLEEQGVRIGVRYDGEFGAGRVFSAAMRPRVREDGSIWLDTDWLFIGRLALPARWAMAEASRDTDGVLPDGLAGRVEAAGWFDVMCGRAPISSDARIALPDGRRVRVLDLRVSGGHLHMTCRTER